jgi:hypothetical protein
LISRENYLDLAHGAARWLFKLSPQRRRAKFGGGVGLVDDAPHGDEAMDLAFEAYVLSGSTASAPER